MHSANAAVDAGIPDLMLCKKAMVMLAATSTQCQDTSLMREVLLMSYSFNFLVAILLINDLDVALVWT